MLTDIFRMRNSRGMQTVQRLGVKPDDPVLAELVYGGYVAKEYPSPNVCILYLTEKGLNEINEL